MDKISVLIKNIFQVVIGSLSINAPANTVKTAPSPAHTAYPTETFIPFTPDIALYKRNMLSDTESMNEMSQNTNSLPVE